MKRHTRSFIARCLRDESGQMLPWMAFLIVAICGMGGLSIDLGRAYGCYHELQASTDAATIAGAYAMSLPNATSGKVTTAVNAYSSYTGGYNVNPNLPGVAAPTVTLKCLTSVGIPCSASSTSNNAIQVQQTFNMPTVFIRALTVFGVSAASSLPITTTSTAAMRGATNAPYNIAVIIDTTHSMTNNDNDPACGGHPRIYCALQGVRILLQSLSPCPPSGTCTTCTPTSTAGSCTPFDQVSFFIYPNIQANTASHDYTCSGLATSLAYSLPSTSATSYGPTGTSATYQVSGANYLSDYSSTNTANAPLNSSSYLTIESGGKSGCAGLPGAGTSPFTGQGTYFAGAIYAAQASLTAAQSARSGSQNALIILSDGDADSSNISGATSQKTTVVYGSQYNQCQQAIAAALAAKNAGTAVYSVAYGAASSGCSSDQGGTQAGLSPCSTMRQLASAPGNFYSDSGATQNTGQCTAPGMPADLNGIFTDIGLSFTNARLIPDNAT